MLLLHVPGATSFQSLRTVNNVHYETFKATAFARCLLASDEEWHHCLTDEATYLMPKQLREMFSYICCFCQPTHPIRLCEDHLLDLTLDFLKHNSQNISQNKALHEINTVLKQHGLSCTLLGLPNPQGHPPPEHMYNITDEAQEAMTRLAMLNPQQLHAFNTIITAVDNSHVTNHAFYLDGPGGSGKTFLYTTLIAYIRGKGKTVLPFATTGIAATLLKGGRTVHSGFKLPVPLLDTTVSSLRLTSPEADLLRQATLIIIDEITMLPKHGLRCIDTLLRDIMNINTPFGNKVIVLGGDFRQTLPVVPRGTQTDILECCIKASHLWKLFTHLTLTTNMRTEGEEAHNTWLLHVGMGSLPPNPHFNDNTTIQIPPHMITHDDLIETIFNHVHDMSQDSLAKRVIVAPTNAHTLDMNRKIIDLIPGNPTIYYSADSVDTEDPNDTLTFPLEFLHNQTPSGMPPHVLLLKKGVIIMLLRNLNPQKGLCNGTRLIIEDLAHHFIKCRILSECNHGDEVFIPRIDLATSDTTLPFILRRRQFPITPAYAITINKSQGQTFDHVGICLQTSVFSHGQLYVALSRSRKAHHVKVHITPTEQQGQLLGDTQHFTKNVVFTQIFHM
ncbi:ATP-dependent DNA helicase pif1-like [Pseudophryne corroboree]|uniref:ATP-dependent DNA helicase pif1-like n=1 Tax=Pseudophryne corroboree TaxID=495146 RepID=UPI0030818357